MPIPTKKQDEDTKKFISRCMGDAVMKKEYPDSEQRQAVCYSQMKKGENMKKEKSEVKRDEKGRLIVAESVPIVFTGFIKGN